MKKIYYIFGIILILTSSCTSDFLKEYSQDLSRVKTYQDLNEILVGSAYLPNSLFKYQYQSYSVTNQNYIILHYMSDELSENLLFQGNSDLSSFRTSHFPEYTWQKDLCLNDQGLEVYESQESSYWNLAYEKIDKVNMILAETKNLKPASDTDKALSNRIIGESYFLRACYYYMLVNLYGKPYAPSTATSTPAVPIKTTEYVEDKEFTRNSVAEVYDQINKDLDQAENYLKDVPTPFSIYHAGINAVYLFHSRIYLYMQDWANAEKYAKLSLGVNNQLQNLINFDSKLYPLNSSSPETIFSMGASALGNVLYQRPNDKVYYAPIYYISDHLYNLFTSNDARKTVYISTTDDKATHLPCYHKIDNSMASWGKYKTVADVYLFRTAEAYLNLAEAAAQLGDNTTACQYLNALRNTRIKDNTAVSLSDAQLVTFIREERERELFLEGQRWFDLRRYMVDTKYPYAETIEHCYTFYKIIRWRIHRDHTNYYRLEKNDASYTLDIPKAIRDFQLSIGSNERAVRPVVKSVSYQ
jgi:hypothetical protein